MEESIPWAHAPCLADDLLLHGEVFVGEHGPLWFARRAARIKLQRRGRRADGRRQITVAEATTKAPASRDPLHLHFGVP